MAYCDGKCNPSEQSHNQTRRIDPNSVKRLKTLTTAPLTASSGCSNTSPSSSPQTKPTGSARRNSPRGLVANSSVQACAQGMQLGFAHRALEPKHQSIIERRWVIDAVGIAD